MPTKTEEQEQPTLKNRLAASFWNILYLILYIALGLTLCYLKVIFGDMCRAPNLSYTSFTDPNQPAPVTVQETTPSLPYYCKEESKQYVKHLFIAEPNFITKYAQFRGTTEGGKRIPPTYTENESSQIFKTFFLETSYILFSVVSVLQSIPDWLIILLHPIIWMVIFVSMFIFTWLISSYNIFMYFLKPGGIFARWWLGWLAGFIAWFVFMCLWGAITVPVGVISGFGQLVVLLSKQQVRVLDPSVVEGGGLTQNPPNESQYKPYSFSKYFLDMVKTSPIIHLMLLFTSYSMVEKISQTVSVPFSKMFTYAFLAVIVLVLVWYKGRFTFIPQDKLNELGWTSHVDPVLFPEKIQIVKGVVVGESLQNIIDRVNKLLEKKPIDQLTIGAKSAASALFNKYSSLTTTPSPTSTLTGNPLSTATETTTPEPNVQIPKVPTIIPSSSASPPATTTSNTP